MADWADGRRAAAALYEREGLGELVRLPRAVSGSAPAWHLYVVRTPDPGALLATAVVAGIGARSYYRVPVHEQPAMREFPPDVALPGTEQAARSNVALPISPVLGEAQVREVVAAVREHAVRARARG